MCAAHSIGFWHIFSIFVVILAENFYKQYHCGEQETIY